MEPIRKSRRCRHRWRAWTRWACVPRYWELSRPSLQGWSGRGASNTGDLIDRCVVFASLDDARPRADRQIRAKSRSEEHTSELQSLMRKSYAGFGLKKKSKEHKLT